MKFAKILMPAIAGWMIFSLPLFSAEKEKFGSIPKVVE